MVERYVALAYDNGVMRCAKDLPQPLLWPQLQVNEGEKSQACSAFNLSNDRPIVGFCPGAEFGPAKRWPHYHYAALAKSLSTMAIRLRFSARRKITRPAKRSSPPSAASSRPGAVIWRVKPSWSRRSF